MSKIKVVVLEDQLDVAENVANILNGSHDMELVSSYISAEDAMLGIETDHADIYLVDLGLPGVSGVDFILNASGIAKADFIVHTMSENGRDLMNALSAGAVGYLIKGCSDDELLEGIRSVAAGGSLLSPRMARRLCLYFKEIGPTTKPLTKTEMEILEKLKTGASYEEISNKQGVCLSTVQSHIKSIYKKLNVNNRHDAVVTGSMFGFIEKHN